MPRGYAAGRPCAALRDAPFSEVRWLVCTDSDELIDIRNDPVAQAEGWEWGTEFTVLARFDATVTFSEMRETQMLKNWDAIAQKLRGAKGSWPVPRGLLEGPREAACEPQPRRARPSSTTSDRGRIGSTVDRADGDLSHADKLLSDRWQLEDLRAGGDQLATPAEGLRRTVCGVALVEHRLYGPGLLTGAGDLFEPCAIRRAP